MNTAFRGINIFGPEPQGKHASRAVVACDDTIVGVLCRSNDMPDTPWWANHQLRGWLGEPFTSKSGDYTEAAQEFMARAKALGRDETDA